MQRNNSKAGWNRIVIFIFIGGIVYSGLKYIVLKPNPSDIYAITPVSLSFGDTSISGGLHKDSVGNFVLVLPDRRVIQLDVKGIDTLDGAPVTVSGNLTPDLKMKVTKIIVDSL